MLLEEASKRRFWSSLVTLRRLLEDKKIPADYFGTSVCDDIFQAVRRHLELSVLVREHMDSIIDAACGNQDFVGPLCHELYCLIDMLRAESYRFEHERRQIEELLKGVSHVGSGVITVKTKSLSE